MYIYILKLKKGKYYVGKSNKLKKRLTDHFNLYGSGWTQKYQPIQVIETINNCDKFDEDKYTLKYMEKYGVNNVRGGSFCEEKLSNENWNTIHKMIEGASDKCYNCGKKGHFANQCRYQNKYNSQSDSESGSESGSESDSESESDDYDSDYYETAKEVWSCEYCDKEFKTEEAALLHEEGYCKFNKNRNTYKAHKSYDNFNQNYKSYNINKNNCYRCGRKGHYSSDCYAKKHVKGYWLG